MKLSDLPAISELACRYQILTEQAKALGTDGVKIIIGNAPASEQLVLGVLPEISRGVMRDLSYIEGKLMRLGVTLG